LTQQDDYYYEIQLTNKQLVFYFLAGALGLVLAFLVGVMVGRGVDNAPSEAQAGKAVTEERIVPEEPVASPSSQPSVEELTYARRLEADRAEETLERPRPLTRGSAEPAARPASSPAAKAPSPAATSTPAARPTPAPSASATPRATSTPVAAASAPKPTATPGPPAGSAPAPKSTATPVPKGKPTPAPKSTPAPAAAKAGPFSIQVGAFSSRDAADAIVARLKKKGYDAFVVTPSEGLFNVRVGRFEARADAERIQAKLRDDEKFKPFIVRN